MSQTPLIKKLRIQPGQRLRFLNPREGYLEGLGKLPDGVLGTAEAKGEFDFIQFFVKNRSELKKWGPTAVANVKFDGLFWLCYPKRSSKVETDLSRDVMWGLVEGTELQPVTQIAIDELWSAHRFRPNELVGR